MTRSPKWIEEKGTEFRVAGIEKLCGIADGDGTRIHTTQEEGGGTGLLKTCSKPVAGTGKVMDCFSGWSGTRTHINTGGGGGVISIRVLK